MRLGINEMITNVILMMRSPALRPVNRDILLSTLGDSAKVIAATTPHADKAALIAQIDTVLSALTGPQREKALAIKSAFENTECAALCALEEQ